MSRLCETASGPFLFNNVAAFVRNIFFVRIYWQREEERTMFKQFIANSGILIAGFYLISKFFLLTFINNPLFICAYLLGLLRFIKHCAYVFSIPLGHGVISDLRHVPLVVVSYYGGMPSALAAGIIMGTGRFCSAIRLHRSFLFYFSCHCDRLRMD